MLRSVKAHRRTLLTRSLLCLPVLGLLGLQLVTSLRGADRRIGVTIHTGVTPVKITDVEPGSPAATAVAAEEHEPGMRTGDSLLFINAKPVEIGVDYDRWARHFERGREALFVVEREGERLLFRVVPGMPLEWKPLVLNFVTALALLSMALLSIAKRPGSLPADLLCWLFLLLAFEVALPSFLVEAPWLVKMVDVLGYLVIGGQFATELHLVSLIPTRPAWLKRFSWTVPLYYAVGLGVAVLATMTYLPRMSTGREAFPWSLEQLESLLYDQGLVVWATLIVVILLAAIFRNTRDPGDDQADDQDVQGRHQAALVLLAIAPWVVYIYGTQVLEWFEIEALWTEGYWSLILLPFPVAIFVMLRLEDLKRHRLLRDLLEQVREAGSVDKISRLVSENLTGAFHTQCNYVFFRESLDSELMSIHASGARFDVERIPSSYVILDIAGRSGEILVYVDDWAVALPQEERQWLGDLGARLIVPLNETDGQLTGLLILGAKRSEEPYTPADLDLLRAFARQIAMAYENSRLQRRIQERERVEREVLDRLEGQKIVLVKECPECEVCYDGGEELCPRDGRRLELHLPLERVIDGRYRLERVLGRGGAAVVYLASDLRLERSVAIKVLTMGLIDDVQAPKRFEREARVAAQLIHPGIVTTLDYGKSKNGLPFLVMEYLVGESLRKILKTRGRLDGFLAAEWFGQILDALETAHEQGVVHRDLKPDNVYILKRSEESSSGSSSAKLLDFGLAKLLQRPESEDQVTAPGAIMGTLAYMAPEQLEGDAIDVRTDLYSIGVMAFEAITGRRPFSGRSAAQLLTAILKGRFELPGEDPTAEKLRWILGRCLKRDRKERPASASELRRELVPALRTYVVPPELSGTMEIDIEELRGLSAAWLSGPRS